jgi:hypothetical protein
MSKYAMLPCLLCGAVLENVVDSAENQPYGGTEFRTYGCYGSTFWDSFDNKELVLNICDLCLRERTERLGVRTPNRDSDGTLVRFGDAES